MRVIVHGSCAGACDLARERVITQGDRCSGYSAWALDGRYFGYHLGHIDGGGSFSLLLHLAHGLVWYCCYAQVHVVVVWTGVCPRCAWVRMSVGSWVCAIV